MYEEVFVVFEILKFIEDNYFVVQINMFGDVEVMDFDGMILLEKDMVKCWGVLFILNIYFFLLDVFDDVIVVQVVVVNMFGVFGCWMMFNMLIWVVEEGYKIDEFFQKYYVCKFEV